MKLIVGATVLLFAACSNGPGTSRPSEAPSASGSPPAVVVRVDAGAGGVGNDDVEQAAGAPSTSLSFGDAMLPQAQLNKKNDGALFMGSVSGRPLRAFYADMRGDIRQAVPLHDDGDAVATIASTAFGPEGSKLFLRLKSGNNTSLFLIDLQGQRPSAPRPLSGGGLVTGAAWQPRQAAL